MSLWTITVEMLILGYYAADAIAVRELSPVMVIASVLCYMILKLLYLIAGKGWLKQLLLLALIGGAAAVALLLDKAAAVLLPWNLWLLFGQLGMRNILFTICSLAVLWYLPDGLTGRFLFSAILSVAVIQMERLFIGKISLIEKRLEGLEAENSSLERRLELESLYKDEAGILSGLKERNRLAQDLHDGIGHVLSSAVIRLEAARLLIEKDPQKADRMLDQTAGGLRDGIEQIRTTLKDLKPAQQEMGVNSLKTLIAETNKNHEIEVKLELEGDLDRIDAEQWQLIDRNIREALSNILKHSDALRATVELRVYSGLIKAGVTDDGRGAENIEKGIGLRGIEERASQIGGRVILDGQNGFSVITIIPLD